jgi:hypothetical protein
MVSQVTQNLFATTYKDDFRDSDNYHRILFNSGRALQARELTQMQTIIQKEISRFANNIFKDGAAVNPGGPTLNTRYEFIKLNTTTNSLPSSSIVGNIFTGASSNIRVKIIETVAATGSDPATIYVQYLGDGSAGAATSQRLTPGEDLTDGTNTLTVQTTNTVANPAVGTGVRISCGSGDFYAVGHFVFVLEQSVILSKYSNDYTGVVGFKITEDVVTAIDNDALYDNQGEVPNTSAPGADRYRIVLTLTDQSNVDSDEMFVYYAKIVNSTIVDQATGTGDYNKINDVLALRTKEESGNYVVRPFKLKFDEDSDNSFLIADVSPGTAYVNGYRRNSPASTKIRVPKPTSTTTINNEVVSADYGNYVVANTLVGVPNVNTLEKWDLRDSASYAGSTIGTARIRSVEEDGAFYNLHLFDIQMTGNNSFRTVKSIGADSANYANLELENNLAVIKDADKNTLLFPLPNNRPSSLTDISFEAQKRFTATTDASGNASLGSGLLGANQTWSSVNDWVVAIDSSGENVSAAVSISGAGTTTASITGVGAANSLVEVLAYVNYSTGTSRSKTLTEATITGTIDSDGNGLNFLDLGKADVYEVTRIRATDSDGTDLTSTFRLDNGQRDNFYDVGKMIVRGGKGVPSGNVFARFKYFTHGAGDFFSVNSYSIDYADIPSHTLADGTVIQLRDAIDFRPRIDDTGVNFSDGTARVNALPKNTDLFQADVTYYMPRYDKLIINEAGNVSILQGTSNLDPRYPLTPANSINLYNIRMNPNTLNESDLGTTIIENKRFTMSDIARLEKRIDNLEEATTLNRLELATEGLAILDSAGLIRTKAGFLADNFADHFFSATDQDDYRAAIDPRDKVVRPSVISRNIRLIYDSDASTNTILKGDNVYVKYTESAYIQQDVVSEALNINPFAVVRNVGTMTLSPASDEWKETQYVAPKTVDGGVRLDADQARLFNEWQWQWNGVDLSEFTAGSTLANRTTVSGNTTTTTIDRVVSDETVREVIGERIVDVALIPFMRSRKVYFRAQGLIPYQRYYASFDGTLVNNWVREETFTRFANDPTDYGNRFQNSTTHPEGSTNLISDADGTIEGSFFIPSTSALRFRTGSRDFALNDANNANLALGTSGAISTFTSQGVLETVEQTIRSTRVITVSSEVSRITQRNIDPLAQSFLVDNSDGVFVTKVRTYFASKPDVAGGDVPTPVQLQIRPMVNGFPSADFIVPGSEKFLSPSEVSVVATQTQAGVLASPTDFVFDEPIYLEPNTEYAIVLLTDSTAYNVYVAQTGEFILGTTERRVTSQPSLGSLFKSQNARTWEPDQSRDLTFSIFTANFDTAGGTAVLENTDVPLFRLPTDPLAIDSGENWITISHPNHGFDSGDTVTLYGLDSATTYAGILGTSILGARTVGFPDQTGYKIYADSAATSSITGGGLNVEASQNIQFDIASPYIETLIPEGTNVSVVGKLTTGKSYAGSETRFVKDASFKSFSTRDNNILTAPHMIANAATETAQLGAGVRSSTFNVSMTTTTSRLSPVLDMQRASLNMFSNLIDKQTASDYTLTGFNVPLEYADETTATGGSSIAKHITTPITLAEDAVGLRIILAANRPSAADFLVYYRTSGEGADIQNVAWTLLTEEAPIPSDENPTVFREYRYLAGGLGGTLNPFTTYQVKIVFRSTNTAKVPVIKDLRAIALAV